MTDGERDIDRRLEGVLRNFFFSFFLLAWLVFRREAIGEERRRESDRDRDLERDLKGSKLTFFK